MKIIDFMKGTKRIYQQNKGSKYYEVSPYSFQNWWKVDPRQDWFYRFMKCHFPDNKYPVRFYSVFGAGRNLKDSFTGAKVFYSGENLESHICYEDMNLRRSVLTYWKYRQKHYGRYATEYVDLALGMGERDDIEKYLRLPEWIPYLINPESDYEACKRQVREFNESRVKENAKGAVLVASQDDYGTRDRIVRDLEDVIDITYAGKWRNNSDVLKTVYNDEKELLLPDFRFNICPENVDAKGYCTEKIFEAFKAGTIPIYHGACNEPEKELINPQSVIFWNYDSDNKDNISEVKRLNEDDAYYEKFVNQVRLYPQTADYIYDKLTELEKRIAMILKS